LSPEQLSALVQKAQTGSSQAFSELYQLYFKRGYYTARKIIGDEVAAEDIIMESFLRLLTKLDTLCEPEKFESWFFAIVYRQSQAYLREKHAREQIDSLDLTEDYEGESLTSVETEFLPAEALSKKEDRALLLRLIDGLPLAQKSALILRYYDDLSLIQIAEVLSVSVAAAKKRLFAARNSLKAGFARSALSAASPVAESESSPVLGRLLHDEAPTSVAEGKVFERTTARVAGCLPVVLAAPDTSESVAARAKAFMEAEKKSGGAARAVLSPGVKVICLAAAVLLLAGASAYGLYRHNMKAADPDTQVSVGRVDQAPRTSGDVTITAANAAATTTTSAPSAQTPAPKPTPTPAPTPVTQSTPAQHGAPNMPATPQPTPAPVHPTITVARATLTYPVGTTPSVARILTDAGAVARDAQGKTVAITVTGLTSVDFSQPGEAHVDLHATDASGLPAKTKVITVVVQ